jgi:hypothetical protein
LDVYKFTEVAAKRSREGLVDNEDARKDECSTREG